MKFPENIIISTEVLTKHDLLENQINNDLNLSIDDVEESAIILFLLWLREGSEHVSERQDCS